jgi:hypothetical protein
MENTSMNKPSVITIRSSSDLIGQWPPLIDPSICCALKLIDIPPSVRILEKLAFSESGADVITFKSGSAVKTIEEVAFTRVH